MKKDAFEPFKFGQNKTSKRSYFPALMLERSETTPDATSAKKRPAPRRAPDDDSPAEK